MALTTGKYSTVVVTRNQIIQDALEDLRVLLVGQAPRVADQQAGEFKLNLLLKNWSVKGLLLWCVDTVPVPMVASKLVYTIGVGGDVDPGYRPLRVLDGAFIRVTTGSQTNDTPLTVMSRKQYALAANKGTTGVPNQIYYDPQMGTGSYNPEQARGKLSVWVGPFDATRTIYLPVQRPIQEMQNGDDAFDLPAEWYAALSKNLAAALTDKFEIPEDRLQRVKVEAKQALDEIVDWAVQDEAPLSFQPDYRR